MALLGTMATPSVAAPKDPDATSQPTCVNLGSQQEIIRVGTGEQFLLRDGEAQYRVHLQGSCVALIHANNGHVESDGVPHRLCQRGSRLKTNRGRCVINGVQRLPAAQAGQQGEAG